VPTGTNTFVSHFSKPLNGCSRPCKLILTVSASGHQNSWDVWVYPDQADSGSDRVPVFTSFTPELARLLDHGGSAILSLGPDQVAPEKGGNIQMGFSSIFWNTAWTRHQAPHTLGILCNPRHPALKDFPTEYYSNWQWWDLVTGAHPLIIDGLDPAWHPIVRVIDDWFTNRRLALVMESRVSNGKLIITGSDLHSRLDERPAAKQFLLSLNTYMKSSAFRPEYVLTPGQVKEMINQQK